MASRKVSAGTRIRGAFLLAAVIILAAAVSQEYGARSAIPEGNTAGGDAWTGLQQEGTVGAISRPTLRCSYYAEGDFKRSLQAAVPAEGDNRRIIGGIVPHHLLADTMISSFFASVAEAQPQLVFVVGPNHKRLGSSKINTGRWDWQTPGGLLEADAAAVAGLAEACPAGENFELLEVEHSISSLVPYVKHYMPKARVVPLVLHGNLGLEGSRQLARNIIEAAGDRKWVIIGSIDFSHYLPPDKAAGMDEITLKAIETADLRSISLMNNDNLDSPPALMTVLEAVKERGDYEMKVTGHSNSAEITGKYSDSTTSYFTILFYGNDTGY